MGHGIYKCSCGTVIGQCRCINHTEVNFVPNGCSVCARLAARLDTPVRTARRRPYEFEAVQYTRETIGIANEWIETGYLSDDYPDYGDWVIKITYPWGTNHDVEVHTADAFRYWFELLPA